jgi:hypothetical protein
MGEDAHALSGAAISAGADITATVGSDEPINCGRRCKTASF